MNITPHTTLPAQPTLMTELEVPRDEYSDSALWSEIVAGLWMGGTNLSDEIGEGRPFHSITAAHFQTVITLFSHAQPVDYYVKEIRLGFFDHSAIDVDLDDLAHAVHVAHSDWKRGRRVLVRCQAGWNRSGLVTALILMREGMAAEDAIDLIRTQRSAFALGNSVFAGWLRSDAQSFLDGLPKTSSRKKTRR